MTKAMLAILIFSATLFGQAIHVQQNGTSFNAQEINIQYGNTVLASVVSGCVADGDSSVKSLLISVSYVSGALIGSQTFLFAAAPGLAGQSCFGGTIPIHVFEIRSVTISVKPVTISTQG